MVADKEIVKKILKEPYPCDGCEHQHKCGLDLMACRNFKLYVNTGQFNYEVARVPTRATYMQIFWGGKD